MTDYKIYKIPHGYYGGGLFDKYAPSVTTSSYECNNLIIEYDMEQERKQKIELPPELQGKKFRIRKLTPRECFRLMGLTTKTLTRCKPAGFQTPRNTNLQAIVLW